MYVDDIALCLSTVRSRQVELPALKQGDSVLVEDDVLESGMGEEPASFALQNLKLPKGPPK